MIIEIGCPVILDGESNGFVVERIFDLGRQAILYHVRLADKHTVLGIPAERLSVSGSCKHKSTGRRCIDNSQRSHLKGVARDGNEDDAVL